LLVANKVVAVKKVAHVKSACHKNSSLVINLVFRLYNPQHGKSNPWHVCKEQSLAKGAMHVTGFFVPQNDKRCGYF